RSFLEFVHEQDVPALMQAFHEALESGEGHNIVFRVSARPGDERHLQMDILTRYTEAGEPLHLRCHLLDVTGRILTERELRRRTQEAPPPTNPRTMAHDDVALQE